MSLYFVAAAAIATNISTERLFVFIKFIIHSLMIFNTIINYLYRDIGKTDRNPSNPITYFYYTKYVQFFINVAQKSTVIIVCTCEPALIYIRARKTSLSFDGPLFLRFFSNFRVCRGFQRWQMLRPKPLGNGKFSR